MTSQFYKEIYKILKNKKIMQYLDKSKLAKLHYPKSLCKLIKDKNTIAREVAKNQTEIQEYVEIKAKIKHELAHYKRKAYLKYIKKGTEYIKTNNYKNAFKWLKRTNNYNNHKITTTTLYKPGTTEPAESTKETLEIWKKHFASLSKETHKPDTDHAVKNDFSKINDIPITQTEIAMVAKNLRNNKACGIDSIPNELYKIASHNDAYNSKFNIALTNILNETYFGNFFPEEWENSILVPIHKKGDKMDPNNCRGIALISNLLKLLTKILAERIQFTVIQNNILEREQIGFIKKAECLEHVADLLECCQRRKYISKENTFICFIDLKKAYDLVPHKLLIENISKIGLGKIFTNFVKRMYNNTNMAVRLGNQVSEPFPYKRGVRQGCSLSPILFDLYINELLKNIPRIKVPGNPWN